MFRISKSVQNVIFLFSLTVTLNLSASEAPVIAFSDLIMAPSSGWSDLEPSKGAAVTIWGRNFGSVRGSSYITVNGTSLTADSDYPVEEPWGQSNKPVPFLQSISFFLNSSIADGAGEISVTVDGKTSNSVPFRVDTGNIYFIDVNAAGSGSGTLGDPWQNLTNFVDSMQPGDIGYFRGGLYDTKADGGKSNIWVRNSRTPGTALKPIGFVAYPGEVPMFDSFTNGNSSNFNKSIKIDVPYVTLSKLATNGWGNAIQIQSYSRVIGCDLEGAKMFTGGTGIIVSGGNGSKMLGNAVHGARSENRLDHSVYFSGCSSIEGSELGYSYSYDNSFDRGPHFVVNHQENRCSSDVYLKSHSIHHNLIDCTNFKSRGIGIYDQSWDDGEANEPEPTYVYNNVLNACGNGGYGAMYHQNGHAVFQNNTLINSQGVGLDIYGGQRLSTIAVNNIFIQSDSSEEYISNPCEIEDSNIYYGGQNSSISGSAINIILADPEVTLNMNPFLFELSSTSPAIGNGSSSVSGVVKDDFFSVVRNPSTGFDIGALQGQTTNQPMQPPAAPTRLGIAKE